MSRMTSFIQRVTLLGCALFLFACSSGNNSASAPTVTDSKGDHPANWLASHFAAYRTSIAGGATSSCTECHGSDLKGGVSKVSCFSAQFSGMECHATSFGHPENWDNPTLHGRAGAMAAPGISSGFAYCAKCHGSDLKGGSALSCLSCHHKKAPHPDKPWIGSGLSHATAGADNAEVCNQCHAAGSNFGAVLVSAPLGTSAPAPGCYNNTMCHGGNVNPPHAKGVAYLQPAQHGIDAAGTNPNHPELGLASCKACHAQGNRFNLGTNNMSGGCEGCHAAETAHPTPWLAGRTAVDAAKMTPGRVPNTTSHSKVPAAQLATSCTPCHGAALQGAGKAPSCMGSDANFGLSCHVTSPVAQPAGCVSCHLAAPTSGAHAKHLALPGVTCDACHTGAGVDAVSKLGRVLHANGTPNVASANYWARTGTMVLNSDKTCSSARCHGGGQGGKTPPWNGGTLNASAAADCAKCHEQGNAGNTPQTPQFNSFYSGLFSGVTPEVNLHQSHLARGASCTDCHTMTTENHFSGLATPTFEGPKNTIASSKMGGYDKELARCSGVTCHTFVPANARWR